MTTGSTPSDPDGPPAADPHPAPPPPPPPPPVSDPSSVEGPPTGGSSAGRLPSTHRSPSKNHSRSRSFRSSSSENMKSGVIYKWTNYMSSWKERYFIVEPGIIKYMQYKGGPVKETILLRSCKLRQCLGDSCRFEIEYPHGVLYLRVDSQQEKMLWLFAIRKAEELHITNQMASAARRGTAGGKLSSHPYYTSQSTALSLSTVLEAEGRSSRRRGVASTSSPSLMPTSTADHHLGYDDDNRRDSDSSEEGNPLMSLLESCVRTRQALYESNADIRRLQSKLVQIAGAVKDSVFRDDIKDLSIRVVEKLDAVQGVVEEQLCATESLVNEETAQRKKLERSIRFLAKQNYQMERAHQQQIAHQQQSGSPEQTALPTGIVRRRTTDVNHSPLFSIGRLPSELMDSDDDHSDEDDDLEEDEGASVEFFDIEDEEEKPMTNHVSEKSEIWSTTPLSHRRSAKLSERDGGRVERRTRLVKPRTEFKISLWSLLRGCIGKDLSRISMPVYFNEPTSFLQRLAEDFQYTQLLEKAAGQLRSVDRMLWVVIYIISPYASAVGRTYKPFNPLLGETYELCHRGFRFLSEQVGHHPPVTAYHAENDCFASWGNLQILNRFTGKSLEVTMVGNSHIHLPRTKDHFTYGRSKMLVNNVIFGKLFLEMFGITTCVNHVTGDYAIIEFVRRGWWDTQWHVLRAVVFDRMGVAIYRVGGQWSKEIWVEDCVLPEKYPQPLRPAEEEPEETSTPIHLVGTSQDRKEKSPSSKYFYPNSPVCSDVKVKTKVPPAIAAQGGNVSFQCDRYESDPTTRRVVWKPEPRPSYSGQYYDFGYMSFELNELSPDYDPQRGAIMPPTDSRFRTDQRAYEEGNIELANDEKVRIEEAQRERARMRKNGENDYIPRWFVRGRDSVTDDHAWLYAGDYWESKERGAFSGCIDIFGLPS